MKFQKLKDHDEKTRGGDISETVDFTLSDMEDGGQLLTRNIMCNSKASFWLLSCELDEREKEQEQREQLGTTKYGSGTDQGDSRGGGGC